MKTGRTGGVVNSHEIMTGDFTRDTEFKLPTEQLKLSLQARLGDRLTMFDAFELAKAVMGDSIYSNMMMLGAAWQRGLVPLTRDAILRAVELNGAAVERNKRAFEVGRWAVMNPAEVDKLLSPNVVELPKTLDERIAFRADHLVAYQSARLAKRYRKLVDRIADAPSERGCRQGLSQGAGLQGRIRGCAPDAGHRGQGAGGIRRRI